MLLKFGRSLLIACLVLFVFSVNAQHTGDVAVWLTTADRASLFSRQTSPLHFGTPKDAIPTIDVDDKQTFQSIDGFGFALTGGSAQLLMRMEAQQRSNLLRELFSPEGKGIGVSYLRVSIGSSDMNDHVFSYDDLPEGQTDTGMTKFSQIGRAHV